MHKKLGIWVILVWGIGLAGCSPSIHQHGWIPPAEGVLQQVRAGVTTKEQVLALWGTPTLIGTFDPNTWYYLARVTESYTSFSRPTLVDNYAQVLIFNPQGTLQCIESVRKDDIRDITCVQRETNTRGYTPSIFKQMFKNLGRFNTGSAGKK